MIMTNFACEGDIIVVLSSMDSCTTLLIKATPVNYMVIFFIYPIAMVILSQEVIVSSARFDDLHNFNWLRFCLLAALLRPFFYSLSLQIFLLISK